MCGRLLNKGDVPAVRPSGIFLKIERRLSSASNKCNNCDLGVLEPHVTALQAFQSGDASAISRSVSLPPNGNRYHPMETDQIRYCDCAIQCVCDAIHKVHDLRDVKR